MARRLESGVTRALSACFVLFTGATIVTATEPPPLEEGRRFWSFQALQAPLPPTTHDTAWPANAIDRFALAKLEAGGRGAPTTIDRRQLLRRIYLDLHGIPPTPAEIDSFLADASPGAYEQLVDRLLESRRFAERWARHWLDIVRYADSTGGGRAMLLPQAWRYRDYVIDSFDRDKPFAEFVTEQIAGDLLEHEDAKTEREAIVATGFLALGPTNYELQDKELLRMDVVDEQIDTIGKSLMGMTLGCARCHDHFFDPIPTTDYYALAGIFRSTKSLEHANVSKWINTRLPPISESEQKGAEARNRWKDRTETLKREIADLKKGTGAAGRAPKLSGFVIDDDEALFEGAWTISRAVAGFYGERYLHDGGSTESLSATYRRKLPQDGRYEVRVTYTHSSNRAPAAQFTVHHLDGMSVHAVDQREPSGQHGYRILGRFRFSAEEDAEVVLCNAEPGVGTVIADAVAFVPVDGATPKPVTPKPQVAAVKLKQLEAELKELEKNRPSDAPFAMSVVDGAEPADYAVNIGGSPHKLGEAVPRGFLSVLRPPGTKAAEIPDSQSGRLQFARWLTSPEHPLVPRVYANRVWYWLNGTGIVPTPDNFGATGDLPTNPELLDHLASYFIARDTSTKALVRYMVLSNSYRAKRGSPKRVDAETLRDSMLAVSGELDFAKSGGPSIQRGTKSEFGYRFDSLARSIYLPVFRNKLPDLYDVFDFPDPSLANGKRANTTLATQALYMMNHPWVIERSKAAARRWTESGLRIEDSIALAYEHTLGREPAPAELELARDFLGDQPDEKRWTAFQQTLFASLDFRHY